MPEKPTCEELEQKVKELEKEAAKYKQGEEAFQQSEEKYQEITSSIPGVVYQFLLKKDGSYGSPYISETASAILDISAKEVMANPYSLFDRIVKEDLDSINRSITESAQTMKTWLQEFRIKTTTGEIRWVRAISKSTRRVRNTGCGTNSRTSQSKHTVEAGSRRSQAGRGGTARGRGKIPGHSRKHSRRLLRG
jgi:PAS domain-containing protein